MSLAQIVAFLRASREELGKTAPELSRELGQVPSAVSQWESRKRYPTAREFDLWARALGCELSLKA